MVLRFVCFSVGVFWALHCGFAFAGELLKAPRCVGRVCLDRIERYKNITRATRETGSGPVVFFENDEGYVSAEPGAMEGSNWVQVSFCEAPGVIKTIHRSTTEEKGADYAMTLESFEKRYGGGEPLDTGNTIYEFRHRWRWISPATELSMTKIRGAAFFSIELRDLFLEEKDFKCAGREPSKKYIMEAFAPSGQGGTRGTASTKMTALPSEMADFMDPGLTAREVLYIMSMQDAMHLLTDMIDVQEKLMGKPSPAEREPIRQELRRIRESMRRIDLDSRDAILSQLRNP